MEFSKIDFPPEASKPVDGDEPAPELNEVAAVAAEEQPYEQKLPEEEVIAQPLPDILVEPATQDYAVEEPAQEPVAAEYIDEVEMVAPEEEVPAIK
jgi:hypothetical protein